MLKIANMNVPHGKLQFVVLGAYFPKNRAYLLLLQGPLDPCRLGLVRTATAMKAPTNKMSKIASMIRVV